MDAKPLSPQREAFVRAYLANGLVGSKAAVAAGYAPAHAASRAHKLLREPAVMAAIEEARKTTAERTGYDVDAAMDELKVAMDLAKQEKQMNAYVRAIELRAKLMGLVQDTLRVELDLAGALIEARNRRELAMEQRFIGQVPAELATAVRARLSSQQAEYEVITEGEAEDAHAAPTPDPFS